MGAVQPIDAVITLPAIQKLAEQYDLSAAHFAFTFRTVAMPQPHTDQEFVSCCLVAREHGLNPLTKEIYFMKTKGGAIQPIVSVDGWVRKCNEHPQFDGLEFEDINDDKGKPIAVTCTIYRKDRTKPTRVTEYLEECGGGAVWKTHPRRMLRHRALTQAARYCFGFAGVMDRDEFDQWEAQKTPPVALKAVEDVPDIPDASPSDTEDARAAIKQAISVEMLSHIRDAYADADWPALEAEYEAKREELQARAA